MSSQCATGTPKPVTVLGIPFVPTSPEHFLRQLDGLIAAGRGAYVCEVCASSIVDASRDSAFMQALLEADVNLPDGAPVAWAISWLSRVHQRRMAGPTVMMEVLEHAWRNGYRVLLYGSTDEILEAVTTRVLRRYPGLHVAGCISPPFRELDAEEDEQMCERMRAVRPHVVLVALGAPKQEKWMRDHRERVDSVLVGVGAGFEYNAGLIRRAPQVMQSAGLEWLFRFIQQPRRTGMRLASTLPVFAWRLVRQIVREGPTMRQQLP